MNDATIQAEYSLLSLGFRWLPSLEAISDTITAEMFTDDVNAKIYRAMMQALKNGSKDVNTVSVWEQLHGAVDLVHVHEIANAHVSGSIGSFAKLIATKAKERQLFSASQSIATLAYGEGDIDARIDQAQAELAKLAPSEAADEWIDAHTGAMLHLDLIEKRESGEIEGIKTGIHDFDELLDGGLQRGSLVVIGARPSMGKTAIAMTMGLNIAQDHHVGFLSMEMPHADVRDRQTAILGNVSISAIKRPKKGLEYDRVVQAIEAAKTRKFYVSDKGGLNILQVRAKARSLKRLKGLDVLVLDYIGLMAGVDQKQSRAYQIEDISKGLKTLAKDLNIVVICLAQVNRAAAEGNECPGLHNLRDSGAIEQDADIVGFIHRPIQAKPELGAQWKDYALFRTSKNRQGRTGDVHLFYVGEQTRFGSWSGEIPSNTVSNDKYKGSL